jgi:hypothetical protein
VGESGMAGFCGLCTAPFMAMAALRDGICRAFVSLMSSSLNALPNTIKHYPLTNDQIQEVQQDVSEMKTRSDEIARLLPAAYGEADQRTIRAEEINAAFERFRWEMQLSKRGGSLLSC